MSVLQRQALGREAEIGALYNAGSESFLRDNMFGSKIENDEVDKVDMGETILELVEDTSLESKFKRLSIEPELQVSIATRLVQTASSSSFICQEKKNNDSVSMSMVYTHKTVSEEIFPRQVRNKINTDVFQPKNGISLEATHVVVGIDWGSTQIFTCEYQNPGSETFEKAKELVKAKLGVLKDALICNEWDENIVEEPGFSFYIDGDCKLDSKSSITFSGALSMIRDLKNNSENSKKGVPLSYKMMSLDSIMKICKTPMELLSYSEVDEKTKDTVLTCVQSIGQIRTTLLGIQADLLRGKKCIAASLAEDFSNFATGFSIEEENFMEKLRLMLIQVRLKKLETSCLLTLIQQSLGHKYSPKKVDEFVSKYQESLDKIAEIEFISNQGIAYVGENDVLDVDSFEMVYVLYTNEGLSKEEIVLEDKTRSFFLKLSQTSTEDKLASTRFFMVDLALRPDLTEADSHLKIHKYMKGNLFSNDVLKDEGYNSDRCMMKLHVVNSNNPLPIERAVAKLRCPNALSLRGSCSGEPIKWTCLKCSEIVWYGIQTKNFYCKCGESIPETALFRCNEINHGVEFYGYENDILIPELMCLKPKKDINALILGETGVGKSTWINGFANYLYFKDLEDAVSSEEVVTVIPSKFTFTNDKGETKDVIIGTEGKNENFTAGQSATQEPVTYPFYVGEQRIQLIDTPGIGDCRGIEQDKKNFENILSHLTYFDEIHAICILLKPNNSRLTVLFRFCIQQLLAHLHKDAARNIVFCFTNARGNFYRPGDTLPALRKELMTKKVNIDATHENMFCFDNEAFRFLACLRNDIQFEQKEVEAFSKSWDVAAAETTRLFNHIKTLPPHKVLNTLSVNDARRIIVEMSRPMAEITVIIQKNIQTMEETKLKMELMDKEVKAFSKDLYFNGFDLEYAQLGYPRTVCTHPDCIEYIPAGKDNLMQTNYKQQCHSHCKLPGVPTETVGDYRLQRCNAIVNDECRHCDHSYQQHMHRTYDLQVISKKFLSDGVQEKINQKEDSKAQMEIYLAELNRQIPEYKWEQKEVLRISANFGSFLKNVAIIPYNDALGDYLDMVIDQENQKDKAIRDANPLASLMTSRKSYDEEKRILEDAMGIAAGDQVTTPDEIKLLQKELFQLKHFGNSLKKIFLQIENNKKKMAQHSYEEVPIPVQRRQRKKKWRNNNIVVKGWEYGKILLRTVWFQNENHNYVHHV